MLPARCCCRGGRCCACIPPSVVPEHRHRTRSPPSGWHLLSGWISTVPRPSRGRLRLCPPQPEALARVEVPAGRGGWHTGTGRGSCRESGGGAKWSQQFRLAKGTTSASRNDAEPGPDACWCNFPLLICNAPRHPDQQGQGRTPRTCCCPQLGCKVPACSPTPKVPTAPSRVLSSIFTHQARSFS